MTWPLPSPLFALDLGDLVWVVVLIIGFISWIVQQIGGQKKAPPAVGGRPHQPPRPGGDRLQQEIEIFLKEVSGKPNAEAVPIEIVPESERRPRPTRRKQPGRKQPAPPGPIPPETHATPGAALAERKGPGSTDLGTDLRSHLDQYMDERVDESVEAHITSHHVGRVPRQTVAVQLCRPSSQTAQRIASLLKDPAGVRQAILLSEILSSPKARRARR